MGDRQGSAAPGLFESAWRREGAARRERGWRAAVPDRDGFIERSAVYDSTERYRYHLWRRWTDGPEVLWVLLNPSTATEEEGGLDPTLRRCFGFSSGWGFGAMAIVNIFALRSTNPRVLYGAADPVGPENDQVILESASGADQVVVGWGNHGALQRRGAAVLSLLPPAKVVCLALTRAGEPGHPLYLSAEAARRPFVAATVKGGAG